MTLNGDKRSQTSGSYPVRNHHTYTMRLYLFLLAATWGVQAAMIKSIVPPGLTKRPLPRTRAGKVICHYPPTSTKAQWTWPCATGSRDLCYQEKMRECFYSGGKFLSQSRVLISRFADTASCAIKALMNCDLTESMGRCLTLRRNEKSRSRGALCTA